MVPHVSVLRKGVVNGKYTIYLNDGTSFNGVQIVFENNLSNFEEIENLTDLFNKSKDIELIMKNLPTKKSPLSDSLLVKLAKHLKKN